MFGPEYWRLVSVWPGLVRRIGLAPGYPARALAANGLSLGWLSPGAEFDVCARIRRINTKERAIRAAHADGRSAELDRLKAAVEEGDVLLMVCDPDAFSPFTDPPRRPRPASCGMLWRLAVEDSEGLVFNAGLAAEPTASERWRIDRAAQKTAEASFASVMCLMRLGLPEETSWIIAVLAFWPPDEVR